MRFDFRWAALRARRSIEMEFGAGARRWESSVRAAENANRRRHPAPHAPVKSQCVSSVLLFRDSTICRAVVKVRRCRRRSHHRPRSPDRYRRYTRMLILGTGAPANRRRWDKFPQYSYYDMVQANFASAPS